MSKHLSDIYCLNCVHSFPRENQLETRKKVPENKYFYNTVMPYKDVKILEFNQYRKNNKAAIAIYKDLKYFVENIDRCKNNPENSSTAKLGEYNPSGFSMSTIWTFKSIEYKHDVYSGNNCVTRFAK